MAYFANTTEAEARLLSQFGLEVTLSQADFDIAHAGFKRMGPFIGERHDEDQPNDFPRDVTLEGDTEGVTPEVVLDFVALRAATLAQADKITPVSSENKGIDVLRSSQSYARPKMSKIEVYLRNAMTELSKYQRHIGEVY